MENYIVTPKLSKEVTSRYQFGRLLYKINHVKNSFTLSIKSRF